MSWLEFASVFALFFATHSIPVRPKIKAQIVGMIGGRGFAIGYSILSVGTLWLLIWSAGRAPFVELWPQTPALRHAAQHGMLAACLVIAFTIGRPNPFSFGGLRNDAFDPARPGIVRITRHPILLALALWGGAHILPNGDLAHVLMFGVLGGFAVGGRVLIDRRKRREMGAERWEALDNAVRQTSLPPRPLSWGGVCLRVLGGVALFTSLLALHPFVIGVYAM